MIKRAIIPAAGSATRLRPLTDNCHKCMLPVGPTTMMKLILQNLIQNGFEEVVIITGFKADEIEKHVRENCGNMIPVFIHNHDYQSTNNAYSLYLAKDVAAGEPFLLLDSDIVFDGEIIKRLLESDYRNVLAVQKRDDLGDEEMKIYSDCDPIVAGISKKGDPGKAIGESIGIEKFDGDFSARLFDILGAHMSEGKGLTEFYESAFQHLIDSGVVINYIDIFDLKVREVDFAEDLEFVKKSILPYLQTRNNEI